MTAHASDWIGLRLENGRYHVTAHLGRGGMGQVYRARDLKLDTDVVLKVPHPHLLEKKDTIARFRREIRSLTRLSHAHILKVVDQGEHDGLPFVVMPFLPGGSLNDRLREDDDGNTQPMLPESLRSWLPHVADALDYIHREGFVHRDVKPHNILFDGAGQVHLADFGLVKALAGELRSRSFVSVSDPGQLLGTPVYLAPEQAAETPCDGKADQYALAVTVYQWLCGRPPFVGPIMAVLGQKLTQTAPPFGEWVSGLPLALETAVLQGLAKEPTQRYPDCDSMARTILAALPQTPAVPTARSSVPALTLPVPEAANAKLHLTCSACGKRLRVPAAAAGRNIRCPSCKAQVQVPAKQITNSIDMKLASIPKGTFWTGGGDGKPGEQQVTIPHDFYIGVYEVTQEQWQAVMGTNPSWFSRTGGGKDAVKAIADADLKQFPVESVSWDDVQEFIEKLNAKEKDNAWVYRLPTEAEWEYICRGGITSKEESAFNFYFDQPTNDLSSHQANFDGNFPAGTAPKGPYLQRPAKVGSYKPNRLGVYDMHGNVWEWCDDEQKAADGASRRVRRGGGWGFDSGGYRAADRRVTAPSDRNSSFGLRLARVPVGRKAE